MAPELRRGTVLVPVLSVHSGGASPGPSRLEPVGRAAAEWTVDAPVLLGVGAGVAPRGPCGPGPPSRLCQRRPHPLLDRPAPRTQPLDPPVTPPALARATDALRPQPLALQRRE